MNFTYIFVWIALLIAFFVTQNPDDDDHDQDGGMMVPSYQGAQ